ncbi:hypothetical protein ACTGVV_12510, partial [Streptococcus suis]
GGGEEEAKASIAKVLRLERGALRQPAHHAGSAGCFQRPGHRLVLVGLHSMIVLRHGFRISAAL